jgi:MFS transporter, MHS family, proline/betaine transporter
MGMANGFWAGTVLCLMSLLIRIKLPETPYFQKIKKQKVNHRTPIYALFSDPVVIKNLLLVISLASCWGVFYQILFIWMPTYLTYIHHFTNETTLQINSFFMVIFCCLIVCVGYCADYISRKFLLMLASTAMFIAAYPLFMLLSSGVLLNVYIAMTLFTVIFSVFIPTAFVCMVESFSTQIRYSALSMGFNIGLAIFGGTCPLIATWLIEVTGNKIAPAFYVMLFAALAFLTSIYIPDKRGQTI